MSLQTALARVAELNALTSLRPPQQPPPGQAAGNGAFAGALDKAVKAGRRQLGDRRATPARQARAAEGIQKAYAAAASGLEKLELSPADRTVNELLTNALSRSATAWGRLSTAAARGRRDAYNQARSAVAAAEKGLASALAGLEAAGYETS